MKKYSLLLLCILFIQLINESLACTVIVAGKKATVDGSLIVSHTDAGPDCRVHVMPGQLFTDGAQTPVY